MTKNEALQTIVQTHFGRATALVLGSIQENLESASSAFQVDQCDITKNEMRLEDATLYGFLQALRVSSPVFNTEFLKWEAE